MYKVIVIAGPTAVGKSDLAVELAQLYNGEVVNGDSVAVYKELNIGSAKISEEEMKGVKHHLVGYKDTVEEYSVAEFQRDARKVIDDIISRGKLPIVCGGTGLYLKALTYDYNFVEMERPDNNYDGVDTEELYKKLQKIDPKSAELIHINNRKRIIRALQIAESGTSKSEIEAVQKHEKVYDSLVIGLTLDRELLKKRINKRVDIMMERGLVEEVTSLFDKYGYDYHCFSAIGYKEFVPYYQGKLPLERVVEDIKTHTRQFAKRQYTWFNNQMDVNWFDITENEYKSNVYKTVKDFITK